MNQLAISDIKQKLDILQIATHYGIDIEKSGSIYRAKHNPLRNEKTSSLYLYPDTNTFCDFGTNTGGDCINFISELKNCGTKEALQIAQKIVGITNMPTLPRVPANPAEDNENLLICKQELNRFEQVTFANKNHKNELLEIAPIWLFKEAVEADINLFKSLVSYDYINKTLVCKCMDNMNGLDINFCGYKRRRYNGGKWVNAKGSKVNNIAFIRIFTDNGCIYVVEGYHDLLTAILLGLDFIALPCAKFKNLSYFDAHNLQSRHIIFICEDKTGYDGMLPIANYLTLTASHIELISLSTNHEKMDLSDYVSNFSNKEEVLKCLAAK